MIAAAEALAEVPGIAPDPADTASAGPQRRCIVSRESMAKDALVRFVVGPDQSIVPDIQGKLPGRGLWVSADRASIETAAAKGLFARAAKAAVKVPVGLAALVERQIVERALALLGLARRSGDFVSGYDTVRDVSRKTSPAVLVAAADGSDAAFEKLKAMAPDTPAVRLFNADELGRAIGRENVVNAMLMPGALAEQFLAEAGRVAGFRDAQAGVTGDIDGKADGA